MSAEALNVDTLRWINDEATDGVTNMARDEALLQRIGRGESPPTLRFYRWTPATISLGYFQAVSEFEALAPPAGDLALVRRQTGGGAILHDLELTYSLTLPNGHPFLGDGTPNALYDHVHGIITDWLAGLGVKVRGGAPGRASCSHGGPFFCFERHSCLDLLVNGRKLMGSAQRRTAHAVLQHGSLILDSRFDQQQCATLAEVADIVIDEHLATLAARILPGCNPAPSALTPEEFALAEILRTKYADPTWTRKR